MQVKYTTDWKALFFVQTIWFAFVLAAFAVLALLRIRYADKKKPLVMFGVFFTIFIVLKIVGGILSLVELYGANFQQTVFTVAYVFNSISIGLLIRSMNQLLQPLFLREVATNKLEEYSDDAPPEKVKSHLFKLLTIVLLISIVLTATGISYASSGNNGADGETITKVGAILFLVTVLIVGVLNVRVYLQYPEYKPMAVILLIAVVFLIIRCIYTILTAFKGINFEAPSEYFIIFGDWKYYAFMAFLMEAVICINLMLAFSWLATKKAVHY